MLKQICAHNPSASQVSLANLSNSLTSQYPPDPGEHVLKKSGTEIGEQEFPVKWFKFICPSSKPRMTETSTLTPVHAAYSSIVFMNHQLTIKLDDPTMFHFGGDLLHSTIEPQHDLPSLAPPKGEITSSSVGLVFLRVPHQALYVLVTLHL